MNKIKRRKQERLELHKQQERLLKESRERTSDAFAVAVIATAGAILITVAYFIGG